MFHDLIKEDLVTTALRELIQIVCVHEIMVLRTCVSYRELIKCYLIYKTISDSSKDMCVWVHTCISIKTGMYLVCMHIYVHAYARLGVYIHLYANDCAPFAYICSVYISIGAYVFICVCGSVYGTNVPEFIGLAKQ